MSITAEHPEVLQVAPVAPDESMQSCSTCGLPMSEDQADDAEQECCLELVCGNCEEHHAATCAVYERWLAEDVAAGER